MSRGSGGSIIDSLGVDQPLMETGLDSLGAVHMRSRLQEQLGAQVPLPDALFSEFPTLRQLDAHVRESLAAASNVCTQFVDAFIKYVDEHRKWDGRTQERSAAQQRQRRILHEKEAQIASLFWAQFVGPRYTKKHQTGILGG